MIQPTTLFFSFFISYLIMFISVLSIPTTNDSDIYVQCSQLYFDSMTPYESNVNSLFTSLVDSSSIYNFNKFQISSPPGYDSQNDVVYGLFQCRADLSSSNCKQCVTNSVSQLKTNCPVSKGGGIQLDGCLVKYDNSSFFGVEDNMEVLKRCGPSVGYNSEVLNRVDAALANLITGNGQYFRSCDFGSIQGVAQCVQDLSASDCQDCLSEACGRLRSECETSTWGDMYLGKCYIRYIDQGNDNHRGKNNCTSSCSKNGEGGNDSNIWKVIGYILAALAGGGLTLSATISIKNCCNKHLHKKVIKIRMELERTKNQVKQVKTEAESATKEAKEAKEKANQAEEEVARMKNNPFCGRPMPNSSYCPFKSTESWCIYEV
uniref:plasmodesmata-located protein 6-like n=1 Tax=Erigeron canadensis TaxID=72917 RepID=UPI001CB8E02C|nr:plasmodesmata-located protein 6-like [Erigeron canadensis]